MALEKLLHYTGPVILLRLSKTYNLLTTIQKLKHSDYEPMPMASSRSMRMPLKNYIGLFQSSRKIFLGTFCSAFSILESLTLSRQWNILKLQTKFHQIIQPFSQIF